MRRSITELCATDHKNDPAILGRWLANKTPEVFRSWIAKPGNSVLVVTRDDTVVAVGSVTDDGEITLNYVSPDARFRGASTALLEALEQRARDRGCTSYRLNSTETARGFYLARGYTPSGPPAGHFGTTAGHPMSKPVTTAAR